MVRLAFMSGVLMFMLVWSTCVVVFMRVSVLMRMTVFDVSMLMLMVMLVRMFVIVFHWTSLVSQVYAQEGVRAEDAFRSAEYPAFWQIRPVLEVRNTFLRDIALHGTLASRITNRRFVLPTLGEV
jgi:hypothetical protein